MLYPRYRTMPQRLRACHQDPPNVNLFAAINARNCFYKASWALDSAAIQIKGCWRLKEVCSRMKEQINIAAGPALLTLEMACGYLSLEKQAFLLRATWFTSLRTGCPSSPELYIAGAITQRPKEKGRPKPPLPLPPGQPGCPDRSHQKRTLMPPLALLSVTSPPNWPL